MNPSRPDVVFDCNVFLQAISRVNGPAAQALRLVERNVVRLYVSKPILRELRRTLTYPEIRQRNPFVTNEVIDVFLARLLFRSVLLRDVPHTVDFSRDPDDEPYINLAAAVAADYLVTRDKIFFHLQRITQSKPNNFGSGVRICLFLIPSIFSTNCVGRCRMRWALNKACILLAQKKRAVPSGSGPFALFRAQIDC